MLVVAGGVLLAPSSTGRAVGASRWRRPRRAHRRGGRGVLAREAGPEGGTLWDLALDPRCRAGASHSAWSPWPPWGCAVETVLTSAVRAERQRTPWSTALRDEFGEVAPLTYAVVGSGPLVALMAPVVRAGVAAGRAVPPGHHLRRGGAVRAQPDDLPADDRHALAAHRGRWLHPAAHAERVADLSVRIGRVLGMPDGSLREVEYAALLHDLGQISLSEPIPGGATVLAAPHDQAEIALEGRGSSAGPRAWTRWPTTSRPRRRPTGRSSSSARPCRSRAGSSRSPTPSTTSPAGAATRGGRGRHGAHPPRARLRVRPRVVEALAVATADATVGRVASGSPSRASIGCPAPALSPRRGPVDRLTPVVFTDAWGSTSPSPASRAATSRARSPSPSCGWERTRRVRRAPTARGGPTSRR